MEPDSTEPDEDLICLISHDWLEDPVQLPCCGKAVSRLEILNSLNYSSNCPNCREDISGTNFATVAPIRNLIDKIEKAKKRNVVLPQKQSVESLTPWKATITVLKDVHSAYRNKVARLEIGTGKSLFKTLVIPVIDRSGSMCGKPMEQVRYSLKRLVDLTYDYNNIITNVITYDTSAKSYLIDTSQPRMKYDKEFATLVDGGGTEFKSAFKEIINVASQHANSPEIASMTIIFLTDGEDSTPKDRRHELCQQLQTDIRKVWIGSHPKDFIVHTIGFGSKNANTYSYDYDFLNLLKTIGTHGGEFRNADPNENDDILSGKINSILDVVARSIVIPIKILPESNLDIISGSNGKFWLKFKEPHSITFSIDDKEPITIEPEVSESEELWTEWYSKLIDDIASELIPLNSKILEDSQNLAQDLHLELLVRRSNAILGRLDQPSLNYTRLTSLMSSITALRKGESVDESKLNDIKAEGQFATRLTVSSGSSSHVSVPRAITSTKVTKWDIIKREGRRRLHIKKDTAEVFKEICTAPNNFIISWIQSHAVETLSSFYNKSNVLHIIASIGNFRLIPCILDLKLDINSKDRDGYTALDLSVIYGYWKTFDILYKAGGKLTLNNELLLRTCLSRGYYNTASRLLDHGLVEITDVMIENAPDDKILEWLSDHSGMNLPIETAISKGSTDIVEKKLGTTDKILWLESQEIFTKTTQNYASIVKMVLDAKKATPQEIFHDSTNEITWPLFIACEKGNLSMVKILLKYLTIEQINFRNNKGTTCLWIAACNCHIDVVYELIKNGADVNIANAKGDSALISCCQKGSSTMVNLLLEAGIHLNLFNPIRDNPVLICCRTGQSAILETLLTRHQKAGSLESILTYYAQVDGFPPLLAATELNKVSCIHVCVKFGADLEWTTDDSNEILPGATALHIACHYGRLESVRALCDLGANIRAQTKVGLYGPLHIAIRSGHGMIIRYLLSRDRGLATLIDADGHLPNYYANMQGREDIKDEFFIDRLQILFDQVLLTSPEPTLSVLEKYSTSLGCYDVSDFGTTNMGNGDTLLSKALINGNIELSQSLAHIGFSFETKDDYGLTPDFWRSYLYNSEPINLETATQIQKVRLVASANLQNKLLTNLDTRPALINGIIPMLDFRKKMTEGYNVKTHKSMLSKIQNASEPGILGFLDKLRGNKTESLDRVIWESRVHIIKLIATGSDLLSPIHILALYLYTGSSTVSGQVNLTLSNYSEKSLWSPFIICLYQAIQQLPSLIGEVYRGVDCAFDTKMYAIGTKITWSSFSVCTTDWRSPSEFIRDKKGIIFIIKSRTGKSVAQYSRNPVDNEVIFLPGVQFTITAIYRPDVIALGQANIRTTTFTAKETDLKKAQDGHASIILEIDEL